MKKKKLSMPERIKHEEDYMAFLQKALASENFQRNDPERYAKFKEKYEKSKFLLKTLKS
jgi:hypothetical protein